MRELAAQQSCNGEVLVDGGPVDAVAAANDLKIGALAGCGVREAGGINVGNCNRAAVAQLDDEAVLLGTDTDGTRFR